MLSTGIGSKIIPPRLYRQLRADYLHVKSEVPNDACGKYSEGFSLSLRIWQVDLSIKYFGTYYLLTYYYLIPVLKFSTDIIIRDKIFN